jgi:3-dehydroquinate synthase
VRTLRVDLGERSYPIHIGGDLLAHLNVLGDAAPGRDVLIVTDTTVGPLYAAKARAGLGDRRIVECVLAEGEQHKTLANVSRVIDVMVTNRFGRDACILALGGGVVGDLAGFAAACYQRGIDFVQLPTTLLAQVDSSVGGKTGVNHPGGKNLIGAFHQPKAVIADTDTLATLPARELRAGLAEVIKYGLLGDANFFRWLEANAEKLLALDAVALTHAIQTCCAMKARIVGRDEHERGERALLNLGHTFGHAIESAAGYGEWLHGEAVGAGLLVAASMSKRCGLLRSDDVARVQRLLERVGLTQRPRNIPASAALERMHIDKKAKAGRIRLVLMRRIGEAFLTSDYDDAALADTLAAHFG